MKYPTSINCVFLAIPPAAREYDAFGNLIPNSNTGTWPGRFGYQGQTWQEIFSNNGSQRLLLSPTRFYDPVTGHFFQRDPNFTSRIFESRSRQATLLNNQTVTVNPLSQANSGYFAVRSGVASDRTLATLTVGNTRVEKSIGDDALARFKAMFSIQAELYEYVNSQPIGFVDPFGLASVSPTPDGPPSGGLLSAGVEVPAVNQAIANLGDCNPDTRETASRLIASIVDRRTRRLWQTIKDYTANAGAQFALGQPRLGLPEYNELVKSDSVVIMLSQALNDPDSEVSYRAQQALTSVYQP